MHEEEIPQNSKMLIDFVDITCPQHQPVSAVWFQSVFSLWIKRGKHLVSDDRDLVYLFIYISTKLKYETRDILLSTWRKSSEKKS